MRSRNEIEKNERREALLNAAQSVFFKCGFERTSMESIAEKAGFSRSLLYVYFKDKKDIYDALKKRALDAMRKRMQGYVQDDLNGLENVAQVGRAFFDFYHYNPDFFHCLSLSISLNNQTNKNFTESNSAEENGIDVVINAINQGLKDGSISPKKVNNPIETAMFLRGSLHGIILLHDEKKDFSIKQSNFDQSTLLSYSIKRITDSLKAD